LKLIVKLRRNYKKPDIQIVEISSPSQHVNMSKVNCFKVSMTHHCNWLQLTEILWAYKIKVETPRSQEESHKFRKNVVLPFSESKSKPSGAGG
jgi:hypothetical protein